jgi:excisionase family DNA binding protein
VSANVLQRRLLTLDEVAERLRVSRRTVERKITAG